MNKKRSDNFESRAEQSRGIVLPICHSHNSLKIVIEGAFCPFYNGQNAPFLSE